MKCPTCGAEGKGRKAFTVLRVINGVQDIQCQACKVMLHAGTPRNESDPDVSDQGGHDNDPTEVRDTALAQRLDRIIELLISIDNSLYPPERIRR